MYKRCFGRWDPPCLAGQGQCIEILLIPEVAQQAYDASVFANRAREPYELMMCLSYFIFVQRSLANKVLAKAEGCRIHT